MARASRKSASRRGGGENRSATQRVECAARKPGTRVTRRSRRTCCAMRVGRSASASSVASSSEVSDAALHRNARTGRPGTWRAPRPERRALAGARARVAAARRFGRSMRDVTFMSTGDENEPKVRRRAWGCGRTWATRVSFASRWDRSRNQLDPKSRSRSFLQFQNTRLSLISRDFGFSFIGTRGTFRDLRRGSWSLRALAPPQRPALR